MAEAEGAIRHKAGIERARGLIGFRDGAPGRRAILRGTRLDVWPRSSGGLSRNSSPCEAPEQEVPVLDCALLGAGGLRWLGRGQLDHAQLGASAAGELEGGGILGEENDLALLRDLGEELEPEA